MVDATDKSRTDRSSLIARLDGTIGLDLTVEANQLVGGGLRRLDLVGADLVGLAVEPGQDLMVAVGDGSGPRRRYTLCDHDPDRGTGSILVVSDHDGVGATWLASLAVGDVVDAVGPRGKQVLDRSATHHLFVADRSAFGATREMAKAATGHVSVVLAIDEPIDGVDLDLTAATRSVTVVAGVTSTTVDGLLTALDHVDLDQPSLAAYVNAEFSVVRAAKEHLVARGVDPARIATKAYWRAGRENAPHGEPPKD